MRHSPGRRALLLAAAAMPLARGALAAAPEDRFGALEAGGGRLGVVAVNTADGTSVTYRSEERFAFCSTFKVVLVSALLKRSAAEPALLERRIPYEQAQVVTYSPVTGKHVGAGMTVADLCAAALQYSDNTAANLIIGLLGGPAAVTAFARTIGDDTFRLDRRETALNTAIPGDARDTTTPAAMARTLRRVTLGDGLAAAERERLVAWMRGNTTGARRIHAGVPGDWLVADKTGTGDYGTTNDAGLVWPPGKPPIALVVYFTQADQAAKARDDVLASATRIAVEALGFRA